MGEELEQAFPQADTQLAKELMKRRSACHQGNANEDCSELPLHAHFDGYNFKHLKEQSEKKKCWQGGRKTGTLVHCRWERKMAWPFWKIALWFLKKLNIGFSKFSPGDAPSRVKSRASHTYLCTEVHSSTIHRSRKTDTARGSMKR